TGWYTGSGLRVISAVHKVSWLASGVVAGGELLFNAGWCHGDHPQPFWTRWRGGLRRGVRGRGRRGRLGGGRRRSRGLGRGSAGIVRRGRGGWLLGVRRGWCRPI